MKILSITSKEDDLFIEDELMKSQEMFPDCESIDVQDYEDIISHDNYWVTQEHPGEIKDLVIFENQGSSYVFDRTKTGSSNACFRVDLYNKDVANPNSIVNILSFLKKGRWFDNSLITHDQNDIKIIEAIVKCNVLKESMIKNIVTNGQSQSPEQALEPVSEQYFADNELLVTMVSPREHLRAPHSSIERALPPGSLYFLGADPITGNNNIIPIFNRRLPKKHRGGCGCNCSVQ